MNGSVPAHRIRKFTKDDVPQLIGLMRQLAVFEGYADRFAVTESDLIAQGLGENPAFGAFVADSPGGVLSGMAVIYTVPWTYDLAPALVLKELFVAPPFRSRGVGEKLLGAVFDHARSTGARRVSWSVLRSNPAAKRFYRRNGGMRDETWELWGWQEAAGDASS